jgi:hypothetical protein
MTYNELLLQIANNLHSISQYCLADTQSIIRIDYEGKFVEATIYRDSPDKASIDLVEDGVSLSVETVLVFDLYGLLDTMAFYGRPRESLELYTSTTFDEIEFIPWACKKIEARLGLAVGGIKYFKYEKFYFDIYPNIDRPLKWALINIVITFVEDEKYPYSMEGVRYNVKGLNDASDTYPLSPLEGLPSELSFDHVLDCIIKDIGL